MFKSVLPVSVVTALLVAAAPMQAKEAVEWGKVGDWQIVIDKNIGSGCIMQKNFENGILLQFGLLPKRGTSFFAAYRQDWKSIESGQKVQVKYEFDGVAHKGQANGYISKPWYGGFVEVKDPAVMTEFALKNTLKVTGPRGRNFELSLDGTKKGVAALQECQSAQPK